MPSYKQDLRSLLAGTISRCSFLFPHELLPSHCFKHKPYGRRRRRLVRQLRGVRFISGRIFHQISTHQSGCDLNERTDPIRTQRYRAQSAQGITTRKATETNGRHLDQTAGPRQVRPEVRLLRKGYCKNTCTEQPVASESGAFDCKHVQFVGETRLVFSPLSLNLPPCPILSFPSPASQDTYLPLPTASLYGVLLFLPPVTLSRNLFLHWPGRFGRWPCLFPPFILSLPSLVCKKKRKRHCSHL